MQRHIEVREGSLADDEVISAIHVAAFGGTAEADLVARLRADGDLLVSLVAVDGDAIVGHVLFSPLPIEIGDRVVPAVALAPLAVMRGRQRQGIGSALVRRGLALCRERGAAAVVVLGDPGYYQRCGFSVAAAAGLVTPWSGPHLMALELSPGALGAGRGTARYAPAFPALP